MIEAGEIDDDAVPHSTARHAAAGAAWDESGASLGSPFHQGSDILNVCRHRYRGGHRPRYSRRLRVNRTSEIVIAKDSPKACGHYSSMLVTRAGRCHRPRLLNRGGFEE